MERRLCRFRVEAVLTDRQLSADSSHPDSADLVITLYADEVCPASYACTQEGLAKVCGLHRNYVGNVEQATVNISLANLEALATGLRCGEEELLRRQLLLPPFR
jgi:hypothetical protein